MSAAEHTISPRGIPAIRTDWLADAAWRLAELGLDALRRGDVMDARLTDTVDGETWRFEGSRLTDRWETAVEFDVDLFLPSDDKTATLRAGFALAPRWDAAHGLVKQVRVEIGPRGAVTFDPENWMFEVPVGAPRPAVAGVGPGRWELRGSKDDPPLGTIEQLAGHDLDLEELIDVEAGQAVPQLRLPAYAPVKRGLLARLTGAAKRTAPAATLALCSKGPFTATLEAGGELPDWLRDIAFVRADGDTVTIAAPAGTLVLRGTDVRARVELGPSADAR